MVDFNKLMSGLTQSGVMSGLAGGLAGGALSGALTSKSGRKTAGSLLKIGGIAAVGGLAWNAYQKYQRGNRSRLQATGDHSWGRLQRERFDVQPAGDDGTGDNDNRLLLIRAMITAAMADGHIDSAEQARIFEQSDQLDLDASDKALLFDELRSPKSIMDIVAEAHEPAVAVEVYAASVLAIDESAVQGQAYLERLAKLLKLPEELVSEVHNQTASLAHTGVAA